MTGLTYQVVAEFFDFTDTKISLSRGSQKNMMLKICYMIEKTLLFYGVSCKD